MQPKDWSRIEKLLENTADKETLDAVKKAVETMETNLRGELTANVVKSVQRGVITFESADTTKTATINSVDTEKSFVLHGGVRSGSADSRVNTTLELTNGTTITAKRENNSATTYVAYQVVEYY